jgi:hypothetical protein
VSEMGSVGTNRVASMMNAMCWGCHCGPFCGPVHFGKFWEKKLSSCCYPCLMPCPANASLEKEKTTTSANKAAGLLAVTARKREIMTPLRRLAHSRRREQETRHAASSHLCHHPSGEDCSHHSKPVSSQQKEACTRRDWADLLHPAYRFVV